MHFIHLWDPKSSISVKYQGEKIKKKYLFLLVGRDRSAKLAKQNRFDRSC